MTDQQQQQLSGQDFQNLVPKVMESEVGEVGLRKSPHLLEVLPNVFLLVVTMDSSGGLYLVK